MRARPVASLKLTTRPVPAAGCHRLRTIRERRRRRPMPSKAPTQGAYLALPETDCTARIGCHKVASENGARLRRHPHQFRGQSERAKFQWCPLREGPNICGRTRYSRARSARPSAVRRPHSDKTRRRRANARPSGGLADARRTPRAVTAVRHAPRSARPASQN